MAVEELPQKPLDIFVVQPGSPSPPRPVEELLCSLHRVNRGGGHKSLQLLNEVSTKLGFRMQPARFGKLVRGSLSFVVAYALTNGFVRRCQGFLGTANEGQALLVP